MVSVLIGLGANLGDRRGALDEALRRLADADEFASLEASPFFETAPAGGPGDQPAYLNGAVRLQTTASPEAVWRRLAEIEAQLGRRRDERWGPRTIDLDLLLYGERIVRRPELCVPHPRLALRRFVLAPAASVAGEMRHPQFDLTVAQLLRRLDDSPLALAVVGIDSLARRRLLERLRGCAGDWRIVEDLASEVRATLLVDAPTSAGAEWRERVERAGRGPWLTLSGDDERRLFDEASALLVALR